MPIATVNDMVIETVSAPANEVGPGIQDAQVLSAEGAKRVALVVSVKQVRSLVSGMALVALVQGSTDLANWHTLPSGTLSVALTTGTTNASLDDVSVNGWPWLRVRYVLTTASAAEYSTMRAVLFTATLSAGG